MKKLLYGELVFITNLSYEEACKAQQKAVASKASEYFIFAVSFTAVDRWQLSGVVRALLPILDNQDVFTIEY